MKILNDIKYDQLNNERVLDLYFNEDSRISSQSPLILYVHGGLWVSRDKSEYKQLAEYLVEQGFTVAVMNYQLTSKANNVKYPSHNEDLFRCMFFLQSNTLLNAHYKSGKFIGIGHSCGGHMIGSLVLRWQEYQQRLGVIDTDIEMPLSHFIGIEGIYDNELFVSDFPEWRSEIEFVYGKSDPKDWDSPSNKLPLNQHQIDQLHNLNVLLIHSPQDTWVNANQSSNFKNLLQQQYQIKNVIFDENVKGTHFDVVLNISVKENSEASLIRNSILNFLK
ncbi:hypothetical protein DLAC_06018 [Tieghemostelium lacteum]|uniref:BD-FAE-like domain-containing protein n=1 Tax=Tieghemostelium lacteum TaxID=361077 RepID=A0A151ZHF1_TIELA|nr:hypothetical protein DLAC_06018 [Tieghemostelium lacteum]|eukprot:KYQ93347.1 hypothetical protein DLAC_06018 [Tieghemostelium lacteum]